MSYSTSFLRAVERTLNKEGGYANDPNDPGGETNYGISKRWNPEVDIKNLTREGAKEIYYRKYWTPLKLDSIYDPGLAYEIFDTAVNVNPLAAIKILQGALTILGKPLALDGLIGPQTISAANLYSAGGQLNREALIKWMNVLQGMAYLFGTTEEAEQEVIDMIKQRLPQIKTFVKGWAARIEL